MAIQLNDGMKQFKDFLNFELNPDDSAQLCNNGVCKAGAPSTWSARRKMSSEDRKNAVNANNEVRERLVAALKDQFKVDSFAALPAGVKKALKGTHAMTAAGDFGFEGGKVASGRPLTTRRIRAVVEAVENEIKDAGKAASAKAAKTKAKSGANELKSSATTIHLKDFNALQTYFNDEAGKGMSDSPSLAGLTDHFDRGFTYKIGNKTLQKGKVTKDVMAKEVRAFFVGHEKLLDVFDRAFREGISTMESCHMLQDGESFMPDLNQSGVEKKGELEVSKTTEDSFRVVYRKKVKDIQSFSIWKDKKPVGSFKRKDGGVGGSATYEYSMSFDMKLENDMPVITPISDPQDEYMIPVGSFEKWQ